MRCLRHLAVPAAIAAAVLATLSAAAMAEGTDTNPRVRPAVGGRHTTYALRLTARPDLIGHGAFTVAYAVQVRLPGHPGCGRSFQLTRARAGETVTVPLRARRAAGWCRGRYHGTVLLSRGPSCARPTAVVCPRFASVIVPAGTFRFRVR